MIEFTLGCIAGSTVTYFLWRKSLEKALGECLEGKRCFSIGGKKIKLTLEEIG
jgi:uncharacterized membrane protein YdjX (TVP38/TMEM64 family)